MVRTLLAVLTLSTGLIFAGFISFLLISYAKPSSVQSVNNEHQAVSQTVETASPSFQPTPFITAKPALKTKSSISLTPSPTSPITPTPIGSRSDRDGSGSTPSPISPDPDLIGADTNPASPTPSPTQTPQTNQVSVSINGSASFALTITERSNQCDVLNKALADGKISSLNMKFDQNFGTYAVYQINGLGKETSVWWTYLVNGQSPNQGCSYIKVKNNDNIEWKYIGPQ